MTSKDLAIMRAMSRAPAWIERGTLRTEVFGQQRCFKAQAPQALLLAR
jgi:hypothetical protein